MKKMQFVWQYLGKTLQELSQAMSVDLEEIFNIVPVGTSMANVGAYLQYGINVINTASISNYALRLPSPPIEGKQVVVINTSGVSIVIYPSITGGSINGVVNGSVNIPSDGKAYTFFCYENPAPGSWSSPNTFATGSYDSGIIVCDMVGPNFFTDVISASDPARWVQSNSSGATTGWGLNGLNSPQYKILNNAAPFTNNYVAFKPSTPWNSITKVTCYTNMTNNTSQGFGISEGSSYNYYATGTTTPLVSFAANTANSGLTGLLTNVVPGTPATTPLTLNPGDPGTRWGEIIYGTPISNVGDVLLQSNINVVSPPLSNVDQYLSKYISFGFQPRVAATGIKFRFIIDYI
jgi:hypothetical protein